MDVIIVASFFSQLAFGFVDKHLNRLASSGVRPAANDESIQNSSGSDDNKTPEVGESEPPEQGSIAALELQLNNLRTRAKELNSPDTFVQYARVSREANKVEKELNEKREQQGIRNDGLEVENIALMLSKALGPSATGMVHRKAMSFACRLVLRVIIFSALWWYFSRHPSADNGSVMTIDCEIVRPVGFLFPKKLPYCVEDDWICAARPPQCKIPFTLAFAMCNIAVAMAIKTVTQLLWSR